MTENKKHIKEEVATTTVDLSQGDAVVQCLTQDVRTSVLIVSIMANMVILTAWIALQVTNVYDTQVIGFLFGN